MKRKIDELLQNLDHLKIKSLMESLEIPLIKETEDYYLYPTACHNLDLSKASEKLYLYKDTCLFVCYTHCGGHNLVQFLINYYETRKIDYTFGRDVYEITSNCSTLSNSMDNFLIPSKRDIYLSQKYKYEPKKNRESLPTYPNGLINTFIKAYPKEWLEDGISREAMDKFQIRFSYTANKIIIPHYNTNGQLVGIRGRNLNPEDLKLGKYLPVKVEDKIYSHRLGFNLYGLNFNKANIEKYGICYIAEGEKSVLQAEGFSMPNCTVATCGSNLTKYHIDLLLQLKCKKPLEVVLCYDKEQNFYDKGVYLQKLWKMCRKYRNYLNLSIIYDRENLLEDKDSPFDKGELTFKKLLDKRQKI